MISRRSFLSYAAALPVLHPSLQAAVTHSVPRRIYIGTGDHGPGSGIMTAPWNATTGEIGAITLAAEMASPSFLAKYDRADGETVVYAVGEGHGAKVSAFRVVQTTGELRVLNKVSSGGKGPTHVSVSPDGRTVLVANYGDGSVSSFKAHADGALSEVVSHFQFSGSGPYKERQEAPHVHSAVTSPDGRFVLVNDLGIDRIMIYHLDPATSKMTPADPPFWQAKPGAGPRHLAWNRNGRIVYCINELDSTVDVLAWSESPVGLRSIGRDSTLPAGFAPLTAFVGEIVISADNRNVYAGNRVADDTICVFNVSRHSGLLKEAQLAPSGGQNSRHVALDPSDRWMVISHIGSNDLTVLERDRKTGKLSEPKHVYPMQQPTCVVFA